MTSRWRIILLAFIVALVVIPVAGVTFGALYHTALDQQRARLVELARNQASLIEAIARYDAEQLNSTDSALVFESVLSQLRYSHAHFEGLGGSGEFTLARREGDQIVFLLNHRHRDSVSPLPIPFSSRLAEPMRRALSGESGTMVGLDYRGETVLAAYEPVPALDAGVVAKIDLAEVRDPFVTAGLWVIGCLLVSIAAGTVLLWWLGLPLLSQLDMSHRRYRTLFDQAGDAIIATDLKFTISDWNHTAEKIYGWRREEVLGQIVGQVLKTEHATGGSADVIAELLAHGLWAGEVIQYHRDGTPLHIFSHVALICTGDGQPYGVVAINRDITGRKQAEEALRENELKYHSLVDDVLNSSASGIYILNAELEVVWVNESIEKFFGFPRERLLGHNKPALLRDLIKQVVEEPDSFESQVLDTFTDQADGVKFECHILPAEGRAERWLEHVSHPIRTGLYAGGRIEHYYDITERKQAEHALRQARNQLAVLVSERTRQLQTATLELQRHQQDLVTLRNVFDITFSEQSLDGAFQAIAREIQKVTDFPIVAIELYDSARDMMVFKSLQFPPEMQIEPVAEVPVYETLSGAVVRTLQRMVETNALNRPEYANSALRQLQVETFVCVPMIVSGEAIGTLSLGHTQAVTVTDHFTDWLANLANYIASLIRRKQTFENELTVLEKLIQAPLSPTTSQALGVKSLHEQSTLQFNRLVDEFEGLMELAVEQRLYKVDHELSEKLHVLAQQLGFFKAGPRDVIELYSTALKAVLRRVTASKSHVYAEEGRLLVLELMGHLVTYYRRFVSGTTLAAQPDRD